MTRRDYVLIATALAAARPNNTPASAEWQTWAQCVRHMADALGAANKAFDRGRFFTATGAI